MDKDDYREHLKGAPLFHISMMAKAQHEILRAQEGIKSAETPREHDAYIDTMLAYMRIYRNHENKL